MTVTQLKKLIPPGKISSSRPGKAPLKADIIKSIVAYNSSKGVKTPTPKSKSKPVKKVRAPKSPSPWVLIIYNRNNQITVLVSNKKKDLEEKYRTYLLVNMDGDVGDTKYDLDSTFQLFYTLSLENPEGVGDLSVARRVILAREPLDLQ